MKKAVQYSYRVLRGLSGIGLSLLIWLHTAYAFAAEWQLLSSPGHCSYTYNRILDETMTECSAAATLMNTRTSEVVRCSAYVKGNQFMAPSVEENVPDAAICRSVGRVMKADGTYGIASLDDMFVDENTKIRRRGNYVWANAFWIYASDGDLDVRICAARRVIQNPDFGQKCSGKAKWPDENSK